MDWSSKRNFVIMFLVFTHKKLNRFIQPLQLLFLQQNEIQLKHKLTKIFTLAYDMHELKRTYTYVFAIYSV